MITLESLAKSGREHGNQMAVFKWARDNKDRLPSLDLMFAIPNGGYRDGITAASLKAEGVKPGVPDICLPVPMVVRMPHILTVPAHAQAQVTQWCAHGFHWHGLFVEMKRPKGVKTRAGTTQDNQDEWISRLLANGYMCNVCVGWQAGIAAIASYLNIDINATRRD